MRTHRLDEHGAVALAAEAVQLGTHLLHRRRHVAEERALLGRHRHLGVLEPEQAELRQPIAEALLALHGVAQHDLRGRLGVAVGIELANELLNARALGARVDAPVQVFLDDDGGVGVDLGLIGRVLEIDTERAVGRSDARLGGPQLPLERGDAPLQRLRTILQEAEPHLRQRLEVPVARPARRRRRRRIERVRRQAEARQQALAIGLGDRRRPAGARRRVGIGRRQLAQEHLEAAAQRRRLAQRRFRLGQVLLDLLDLVELRAQRGQIGGAAHRDGVVARRRRRRNAPLDGVERLGRALEPVAQPVGRAVDGVDPALLVLLELRRHHLEHSRRQRLARIRIARVRVVDERAEPPGEVGVHLVDLEVVDVGELGPRLDGIDAQRPIGDAVDERVGPQVAGGDEAAPIDPERVLGRDRQRLGVAVVAGEVYAHERPLVVHDGGDDGAQAAHAALGIAGPHALAGDDAVDGARPRLGPHRRAGDEAGLVGAGLVRQVLELDALAVDHAGAAAHQARRRRQIGPPAAALGLGVALVVAVGGHDVRAVAVELVHLAAEAEPAADQDQRDQHDDEHELDGRHAADVAAAARVAHGPPRRRTQVRYAASGTSRSSASRSVASSRIVASAARRVASVSAFATRPAAAASATTLVRGLGVTAASRLGAAATAMVRAKAFIAPQRLYIVGNPGPSASSFSNAPHSRQVKSCTTIVKWTPLTTF